MGSEGGEKRGMKEKEKGGADGSGSGGPSV